MDVPIALDDAATIESPLLAARYATVRQFSERLIEPLSPEDCCIQSMPDVSPTKWHLAHTTWFFETFVLEQQSGYRPFAPEFRVLFNSYYNGVGEQFPRPQRGLLSRPGLADVLEYRRQVDDLMRELLEEGESVDARIRSIIEIGLNHEQQHQELMLTDIKHVLAQNPLRPAYRFAATPATAESATNFSSTANERAMRGNGRWVEFGEGVSEIGHTGSGFAYDNESPRHRKFLESFALASHPVTCGEWLQFMNEGGYARPEHWLSLGWSTVCQQEWRAPLYWYQEEGQWWHFTLAGAKPVDPDEPVCHVSYLEADAFARWTGYRLPTEAEWEVAASDRSADLSAAGNFADTLLASGKAPHPSTLPPQQSTEALSCPAATLERLFGDVWEWTASPYTPYPGYLAPDGALGEYNGKFMCNQYVLRGGSCATSASHMRATYRNFFPAEARWQFTGLRLARDV